MSNKKDLTNMRFGRLTVIREIGRNKHREVMWLCKCDCGKEHITTGYSLRSGATKSCGCLRHDTFLKTFYKHGLANKRLYSIWAGMKNRCYNDNEPAYKWYGARGIGVCNEWRENPVAFYEWAKCNGYDNHLSIDRINNNGDYCPENCRWVDMKVQSNNRRNNHRYTFKNKTLTIREWSNITGLSYNLLRNRLEKNKWSIERALTTPKIIEGHKLNNKVIEFDGEKLCIAQWARKFGINDSTLRERLKRGWNIKDALTKPLVWSPSA